MSTSFSANQYDDAFKSHNLQNWEVPMKHKKATWFNTHYQSGRPDAQEGFTQIIANDQGHLEPGVPRSNKNPWGDFVGTWDLPKKIPGNTATVATARRPDAQDKLTRHMDQSNVVIGGQQKNTTRQCKGQLPPVAVPEGAPVSNMLEAAKEPIQLPPVAVPEGAPVSNMLEAVKEPSPCVAGSTERRSGAEAPMPASTSPAVVAKTPSPAPAAEC